VTNVLAMNAGGPKTVSKSYRVGVENRDSVLGENDIFRGDAESHGSTAPLRFNKAPPYPP